MSELWNVYISGLPASVQDGLRVFLPFLQIAIIVIGAVLLQKLLRHLQLSTLQIDQILQLKLVHQNHFYVETR